MSNETQSQTAKLPTANDIEKFASVAGLSMAQVCRSAEMSYVTFWNWKAGKTSPSLHTVQRLLTAIDERVRDAR